MFIPDTVHRGKEVVIAQMIDTKITCEKTVKRRVVIVEVRLEGFLIYKCCYKYCSKKFVL